MYEQLTKANHLSCLGLLNTLTASLQRGNTHLPNKCPGYDTKPPDGGALILEFWVMWNTPSLQLLLGPL